MAKGKVAAAEKIATVQAAVPVVIWRVNRPLNEDQHAELARKLRVEQEKTGVEIMLVPNSVDIEIGTKLVEQSAQSGGASEADEQKASTQSNAEPKTAETDSAAEAGGSNDE